MSDIQSPRLAALQSRLAAHDGAALSEFWRELEESGTPLVEPSDESGTALVTLVLRNDSDDDRFVAPLGFAGLDPQDRRLRRLDGSDVTYKTYLVPRDIRTIYVFAPTDDPNTEEFIQDPLARRQYVYPSDEEVPDDEEFHVSIIELPDAPQPVWGISRGAPAGATELHRFQSAKLDGARRIYVYTPPQYNEESGPYPLLILFDGWAFTRTVSAPIALDNLIEAGVIPPIVAILPDSPDMASRMRDLWLYPPFNDFLAGELLPWAKSRWAISGDPARVVVSGSSLGGLAAAYFALERPEIAGCVLSMSGAFSIGPDRGQQPVWISLRLAERPLQPIRFWLDVGTAERVPWPADVSALDTNRHVRDVLAARGYQVTYREYPGGHDYFWWIESLGLGLIDLLGTEH